MKNKIFLFALLVSTISAIGQVQTNNGTSNLINGSNAFIDGSTSFSVENGAGANEGKGIIVPSVDLVNFEFDLTLADGFTFPTYFDGMLVYNNSTGATLTTGNRPSTSSNVTPGFYYFSNPNGSSNGNITNGQWIRMGSENAIPSSIDDLDCASATLLPATIYQDIAYSGLLSIPYTDGNGAAYPMGLPIASTGVTGLTAKLEAGILNIGSGNLIFHVTGTPSGSGIATFAIKAFDFNCVVDVNVNTLTPIVTSLNCNGRVFTPATAFGLTAYTGVVTVPYSGGNGVPYATITPIASTGVTGLTATLQAATLANGNGTLTFDVTGTPSGAGTANFLLSFGSQNCSFSFTVSPPVPVLDCVGAIASDAFYRNTVFTGTITIPYTGGDGSSYAGGTIVSSTGTTGLTATLQAGTFAASGNLVYSVTGTPAASGSNPTFSINFNGATCNAVFDILPLKGNAIINCAASNSLSPKYAVYGQPYSGSKSVRYTSGTIGGHYPAQSIASSGVLGLTATSTAGTITTNSGSVQYAISGTPDRAGDAVFVVNTLGGSCTFFVPVAPILDVNNIVYTPSQAYSLQTQTGVVKIPYQAGIASGQYAASAASGSAQAVLSWALAAGTYAASGTLDVNWSIASGNGTANGTFLLKSAVDEETVVTLPLTMNRIGTQANPTAISCTGTNSPATFTAGVPYLGTRTITYSGATAGRFQRASSFESQGVTGLTASYGQNTTTSGSDQPLLLTITGTPSAAGTALFNIEFGGLWCTFSVTVN